MCFNSSGVYLLPTLYVYIGSSLFIQALCHCFFQWTRRKDACNNVTGNMMTETGSAAEGTSHQTEEPLREGASTAPKALAGKTLVT